MNIKRQGGTILDTDLLDRLAFKQASGKTVSIKEAQTEIRKVKKELKSNYRYTTSKASFTRAQEAISNTFNLAISSGWVKGASAKSTVREFVKGKDATALEGTLATIREDAKGRSRPSSGYSSYSSSYGS